MINFLIENSISHEDKKLGDTLCQKIAKHNNLINNVAIYSTLSWLQIKM